MIREKFVRACNESEYFALIGDETTDALTNEQVSVCVRFLECSTYIIWRMSKTQLLYIRHQMYQ